MTGLVQDLIVDMNSPVAQITGHIAATAILILSLGICASAAIFAFVNVGIGASLCPTRIPYFAAYLE